METRHTVRALIADSDFSEFVGKKLVAVDGRKFTEPLSIEDMRITSAYGEQELEITVWGENWMFSLIVPQESRVGPISVILDY